MMKESAGILLYRKGKDEPEVFLVHPGGPFFRKKVEGAWSIPKGLPENDEDLQETAKRALFEETGIEISQDFISLGTTVQKGGKKVYCWTVEKELPEKFILKSNHFELEWPPKSGNFQSFPEVDKAEFFNISKARKLINPAQQVFLNRLLNLLKD